MIVQDHALALHARDYSESSQIVALWTEGHGRVTGIAKGVRRDKRAAFDGPFEPAARYEVGFYPRPRGEGLCILSESSLVERHPAPRETLEGWWAWSEASEAVIALTQEMDPHAGLTADLQALLKRPEAPGALPVFLMRLLDATGHAPTLDACAGCGEALPPGRADFAFWIGGIACPACARGPVAVLSGALRQALKEAGDPASFPVASRRVAEALLARYIAHVSGEPLASSLCRARARRALQRLKSA